MTVAIATNKNRYVGSGTTGPFPYGFHIVAATELVVTRAVSGIETTLAYPADYSVTGVDNINGGSITLTVPLLAGAVLVIRRILPLVQPTSIQNGGPFYAKAHEQVFDRGIKTDQQLQEQIDRSLRLPPTTDPAVTTELPAPEASKFLGWDATGTRLINGQGAVGPQGPAGLGGPIPVFDTTAARDAFYPAPAANNMAFNRQTGRQERYGTPSAGGGARWLPVGVTSEVGPIVNTRTRGAFGTGAVNDRPYLADADALAATSGIVEHDPGTYRVDAALTLAGKQRFNRGAKLQPNVGINIDVQGDIGEGADGIFDMSLGGTFSFFNNTNIRLFRPQWFGIYGKGAPESALMNKMIDMLPDGAEVQFATNMNVVLDQNPGFRIPGRTGIKILGTGDPRIGDFTFSTFTYTGPTGGTVCFLDSDTFSTVQGFKILTGMADVCFDLDKDDHGHIGSNCIVEHNLIVEQNFKPNYVAVRISETVLSNHEYHEVIENVMRGAGGIAHWNTGLGITTGTNVLTRSAGPFFDVSLVGARVWILGAGAAGAVLATTVAGFTNANTVTLVANAGTTVANGSGALSNTSGTGIKVSSSNTHKLTFNKNDISGFQYGHNFAGGSFEAFNQQTFVCDENYRISANSLPCFVVGDNSESSLQHLKIVGLQAPFTCHAARINVAFCKPGEGFIDSDAQLPLLMDGCTVENTVPPGCKVLNIRRIGTFHGKGWVAPSQCSMEELGLDLSQNTLESFFQTGGVGGGTYMPAGHVFGSGALGYSDGAIGQFGLRGETRHSVDNVLDFHWGAGVLGSTTHQYLNNTVHGSNPPQRIIGLPTRSTRKAELWGVGVCGTGETLGNGIIDLNAGPRMACLHARLPIMANAFGNNGDKAVGLWVTGAELDGVSKYNTSYGVLIEPLQDATHSPAGFGVKQEGTKDKNEFAGPMNLQGAFLRGGIQTAAVGAGGNVTPTVDIKSELRATAAGNITINDPIGTVADGHRLTLKIKNNTGGAITVTLGAGFQGTFTPPAAGLTATKEYSWDATAAKWAPVGAQSPDF